MKKEIVVAILMGVVFGLAVAGFMVFKTVNLGQRTGSANINPSISPAVQTDLSSIKVLEVKEPTDQLLVDKNKITVRGKAGCGDLVIIKSPIKELVFNNKKEDFAVDFPLALGENIIVVTVYPKNGQITPQQKSITVYNLDEQ